MNTDRLGETTPFPATVDARLAAGLVVAVVGAGSALLVYFELPRPAGADVLFMLFMPGVLAAAWLGGGLTGLTATCLGLAGAYIAQSSTGHTVSSLPAALFIGLGLGLSALGQRTRARRAMTANNARRLREREAHLQSILDTVPDAMLVVDDKGLLQSFSSTAEQLFGWSGADVMGQNIKILMPDPDRRAHDSYMEHYMSTGERRIIGIGRVVVGLKRDGSTFRMHLSVGEMRVGDRRFFTGFVRDLTEREQTEARMQELQSELAHLSRLTAMGEMASALAHELNQPLSAIANYLRGSRRLLDKGDPSDRPRLSEALGKAADQAVRAGDVIQRLRQFVGRGETEKRLQNLPDLVDEASTLALVGARELGIRVTCAYDPTCKIALVDRVQLQQVVINLLRNAVDAMRGSARRNLDISISPTPDGFIAVSISDTGSGIGEQTLGRLFEPFMTTKKEGMGVGLSICRTIVEAHGGSIWAQNNLTEGATFTFTLPKVNEASASV